jgi:tRNA threonylcarbamoyl adenosine modification protein (Sua5/YciO/YrdC/YwlC family)
VTGPIEEAVGAALRGQLVVLPTDTVYGIGSRPDRPTATEALFAAKGRPRHLELPVLVSSVASAADVATMDDRAHRLADGLWPGAVTLVLPRTEESASWELGGDPTTIGVRVPRHPLALALVRGTGPLAVTSANRSGEATPSTCDGVVRVFGDAVAVYLCEDVPVEGRASTVVDLAHGDPVILREGDVSEGDIARLLAR